MAQRWPAPNVKPKLTQDTFDEAVKTNIEDFDMAPAEAVKSATDEFLLQGYDMSCVVKTSAGADLSKHALSLATQAVADTDTSTTSLTPKLQSIQRLLDAAAADGSEALQETCAVALTAGTLATVLNALRSQVESGCTDTPLIQAALTCARSLMAPSVDIRDSFQTAQGPQLLMTLHSQFQDRICIQTEVARCAECACFRQEQNKDELMHLGYGVSLLQLLTRHAATAQPPPQPQPQPADSPAQVHCSTGGGTDHLDEAFVTAACGVLRALTTADDDRPPCSNAFANARLLAKQHQGLSVLLSVLRLLQSPSCAPTVAAVLSTIRQLSANEEICKDFSDDGGVTLCLQIISSLSAVSKDVVRCGLGALRQLTNSDHNKKLLAQRGAVELLMQLTALYPDEVDVAEQTLGVMANLTLRQPQTVEQCAEAGVMDWVMQQMRDFPSNSQVQRQAAILVRNMVGRNPEYRPGFLSKGAEALLRHAKRAHPKTCTDVGSAALRDLGCDNYNDNWKVGGNLDIFLKAAS